MNITDKLPKGVKVITYQEGEREKMEWQGKNLYRRMCRLYLESNNVLSTLEEAQGCVNKLKTKIPEDRWGVLSHHLEKAGQDFLKFVEFRAENKRGVDVS